MRGEEAVDVEVLDPALAVDEVQRGAWRETHADQAVGVEAPVLLAPFEVGAPPALDLDEPVEVVVADSSVEPMRRARLVLTNATARDRTR